MKPNYVNDSLHYKSEGSGETVILIHGFLENLEMWDGIAVELLKTHRVIRMDLPGFGKTAYKEGDSSIKGYAAEIHVLIKQLKVDSFTIIGHSMGGYIALELAKISPEKVNHIILFHSTASADSELKKKDRNRAISAVKEKKNIYLKTAIPFLFSELSLKNCASKIQKMRKDAEDLNPKGIINALRAMQYRTDHNCELNSLRCKKTYIAGILDPLLPIQNLKTEAQTNKADFIEIENAGHMSHWENTSRLIEVLKKVIA